jgi:hypothetical protein
MAEPWLKKERGTSSLVQANDHQASETIADMSQYFGKHGPIPQALVRATQTMRRVRSDFLRLTDLSLEIC